jgi:hypothetical protein
MMKHLGEGYKKEANEAVGKRSPGKEEVPKGRNGERNKSAGLDGDECQHFGSFGVPFDGPPTVLGHKPNHG